ncbi:MAG: hypothetical protein IID44_02785 [Planctomycetes bacterium]|nr:hypothetical protein [Planctomycetota bacterium]
MASQAATLTSAPSGSATLSVPGARTSGWIVSPWFDILFFVNVFWLLAFLPAYVSAEGVPHVEFWQVHFIASPHRWITLFLIALDPDRRGSRAWLFVLIAVGLAAVLGGVQLATGGLAALGVSYYAWNSWHFAAQHSGIVRMYSRKAGGGRRWLETYGLRTFILYAGIRLIPGFDRLLGLMLLDVQLVDWAVLVIPAYMIAVELTGRPTHRAPKLLYLTSVCLLYTSIIMAAHTQQRMLILALVAATTIFHSVEYFAFLTHYARRRQTHGSPGMFQKMARHWVMLLAWFLVSCGIVFSTADRMYFTLWYAVNLWASFLHFAYDGLIWKFRVKETAKVLDIDLPSAGAASAVADT